MRITNFSCDTPSLLIRTDQNQNLRDMMREEWNLLMKGRPTNGWGGWDFDEEELLKMMEDVEADLMVTECGLV